MKSSIIIRQAMPDDSDVVAPLIYAAASRKYDYWLGLTARNGNTVIKALSDAFINNAGVQGYEFFWVATQNDEVVGVGACYQPKQVKAKQMALLKWALRYYGILKIPQFIKRGLELSQLQHPIDESVFYAANLAVAKSHWGQGIATLLIQHFEQIAIQQKKDICLDVAVSNERAKGLYEHLGYKAIRTSKFTGKVTAGIPDSIRMLKILV